MNLQGKVALVTGSSRGIGKGIAKQLAQIGASVIINYKKNREGAEETLKSIKELGGYASIIQADVSDYNQVQNMINSILEKFGKIDILVNNAGISTIGLFMDATPKDWDCMLDTNLKGVFNCTNCVVKHMISRKEGSIINISSIWGNEGASCEVLYSATKGGINSFTKALAKELGPSNIRVNAIAPGVIDTQMNKWLTSEEKQELVEEIPLSKFGTVEDIGKVAAFLASNDSKYITGQIITVDGGMF